MCVCELHTRLGQAATNCGYFNGMTLYATIPHDTYGCDSHQNGDAGGGNCAQSLHYIFSIAVLCTNVRVHEYTYTYYILYYTQHQLIGFECFVFYYFSIYIVRSWPGKSLTKYKI